MGQAYGARGQRQWLANIGKRPKKNGVLSVSSLFADEGVYWPVNFENLTLRLTTSRALKE